MPQITTRRGPSSSATNIFTINHFRGIDLANSPANVDKSRSCNGLNMIRDVPGKIKKRTGYERIKKYDGRINGIYFSDDEMLVHAGEKLYLAGEAPELIYDGMEDARSTARPLGGKLWILDGRRFLVFDPKAERKVKPVDEGAYVPTVTISRTPDGGGMTYMPVNMLSDYRTEMFLGVADKTVYQLSFENIKQPKTSEATVSARKMGGDGEWITMLEGSDFSADYATGKITFTVAPGAPPVTGEDNVEITYAVENNEYRDKINRCRFSICYGVSGAADRLFISGNDGWKNYDFHSEMNDPTYFGDEWYGVIGQAHSPIMGYSIINDHLATHKRDDENGRNIILRKGTLEQGDLFDESEKGYTTQFRITGIIQGDGAISPHSFGYAKEPIFLTSLGICATTPYEYNAERYVQNRSFYINPALLKEPGLDEAVGCVYEDFYMLAVNGKIYILDTLEQSYEKTKSSAYQYECYLFDNVPARVLTSFEGQLYFGTANGHIMRFYAKSEAAISYLDAADDEDMEGTPIRARWDFDFSGQRFYKNKTMRYLAVRIAPSVDTSLEVFSQVKGIWRQLIRLAGEARFFAFSSVIFSKFTFSGDTNPRTIGRKIRIKRADAARFSFRNEERYQPFGIYEIALELKESGYYRG